MRYVELGLSGRRSSILGFGCSALMGRVGRRDSQRALGAAYETGINFFDTARSYGYGESEAVLGEFLVGRRDQVVISTKFGILPVEQQIWKRAIKPIARKMFSALPALQGAVRNQIASQFQSNQFTVGILRASLDTSLRKLRTDYVDLLFMHCPPASVFAQNDLLLELENLISAGKVLVVGVSSDPESINSGLMSALSERWAVQFPCNLLNLKETRRIPEAVGRGRIMVANLPFGGTEGIPRTYSQLRALADVPEIHPSLRQKLMGEDRALLADVVLNVLVRHTGIHVVVPSMMRVEHLHTNVQAIVQSRFSDREIAWMRETLVGP